MGTFGGHVLPGSFFILFGVWWSVKMYYRKHTASVKRERFTSSATFRCIFLCGRARDWPIEGILKIFLVTVAGIIEIITGFDNHGHFINLGNGQHATMFLFFGLSGVIDILLYFRVSLPNGMDYASVSLALVVEFILFKFHLHGRPPIDVLIHTLLLYVIAITVVVVILEMRFPHNFLLALTRAYLVILQGTWFWQVAFILYNPTRGWKPWDLHSHENVLIATMYFTWHMAVILVYMLTVGGLVKIYVTRRYGPIDDAVINPLVAKSPGYAELSMLNESDSDIEYERKRVVDNNGISESSFTEKHVT